MKKVLFFFLAFIASVTAFAGTRVTSLDQLSNSKAYTIHAENGLGYLCYAPQYEETYLYVVGATVVDSWDAAAIRRYKEPLDESNPNHLWKIKKEGGNYYLYNLGAKKYAKRIVETNRFAFTDEPTPIAVTGGNTFAFGDGGGCVVVNQWATTPVRDGGSATPMVVEEVEYSEAPVQVTALDQLSNNKTYTIHAQSGFGYICYAPEYAEDYLFVRGATATNDASNLAKFQGEVDRKDPSNLWQILNDGENYYLYSVGAKRFVTFNNSGLYYEFTDVPTAINVQDNGTVNEEYAGTFGFRLDASNSQNFLCISHNSALPAPVAWWEYNDNGAVMIVEEAEYPADDPLGLNELADMFAEMLATAKAEYENGNVCAKSDNLFTNASQFHSAWTDPTEGSKEATCDGNPDTFWHSSWQIGAVAPGTHDFYITLPEAVGGNMELAMTRRRVMNDHILAFDVYTAKEAYVKDDQYDESVDDNFEFVGKVSTPFANNTETVTAGFTVPEGTKQIRFVIAETTPVDGVGRGYGHFAEFQLYTVGESYNAQNPKAAAAFAEAIAKAEAVTQPTEDDILALYAAAEAYAEGDQPELFVGAIRLAAFDNLYFSTTEVADNDVTTYSLSNEPEYFTFAPTEDGGYILQSTSTGKYVGHSVLNSWDFSDDPSTWYIDNLEGEPTAILKSGSFGFGVDGYVAGKGVFTDKMGFRWVIEAKKAEEPIDPMPQAGKAYFIRTESFGTSDDVYYVGAGEQPETEPVAWLCSVDENGMYSFMNETGDVLHFRGWENGGTAWGITPMTELTADDMNQGSLPAEYVKPEVVVMQGYHYDGRFIYLNVNFANGKYDHGGNVFAPWNSSYNSFFVFEETEVFEPVIEWNGEINVKEDAATIDELLEYPVEFKKAQGLSVSPLGLLGAIFNESGDVYAVAFVGQNYEQFGSVEVKGSTFNVQFEKVADIKDELKESVIQKIGGFIPTAGVATVYFCPKSFVFDGATYGESLKWEYTLAGSGNPTGIESVGTDNAADVIYDLQGRRVVAPVKGNLYIQNGKKVMK